MKNLVSAAFLILKHCSQFDNAYVGLIFGQIPRIQVSFTVEGRQLKYVKAYSRNDLSNKYLTPEYIFGQYLNSLPPGLSNG